MRKLLLATTLLLTGCASVTWQQAQDRDQHYQALAEPGRQACESNDPTGVVAALGCVYMLSVQGVRALTAPAVTPQP